MPRRGRRARGRAAEEGSGRRQHAAQPSSREPGSGEPRVVSREDTDARIPPLIDVFHYEPRLETTDYHLFQKLKFYVLPNHSLRLRPEMGYVRLYDLVYPTESLPYPVELSCGVFACMAQRLGKNGSSLRYPDPAAVRRALDSGRFLRCIDFRQYIETMWQSEKLYWDRRKRAIASSPTRNTMETLFNAVTDPIYTLDFGEMCERLALLDQSYSEDAGQRCSLIIAPKLPAFTAEKIYSQLHGILERTFELFLVSSECRELPQLPRAEEPSYSSEDEEWTGATQLIYTSSAEDIMTSSPPGEPRGCPLDSCDGGSCGLSLSPQSGWSGPWDERLPLSAEEDDPALSRLLVRSLVSPGAEPARRGRSVRHRRLENVLESGAEALGRVLFGGTERGERESRGTRKGGKKGSVEAVERGRRREVRNRSTLGTSADMCISEAQAKASAKSNIITVKTEGTEKPKSEAKSHILHQVERRQKKRGSQLKTSESVYPASKKQPVKDNKSLADLEDDTSKLADDYDGKLVKPSGYLECPGLQDRAMTVTLACEVDDKEHNDVEASWHFVQHYAGRLSMQFGTEEGCAVYNGVQGATITNDNSSVPDSISSEDASDAVQKLRLDRKVNCSDRRERPEKLSVSEVLNDEPKEALSFRSKDKRRRRKASNHVSVISYDSHKPRGGKVEEDIRPPSVQETGHISGINHGEQLPFFSPGHGRVYGANLTMENEVARVYVPSVETQKLNGIPVRKPEAETSEECSQHNRELSKPNSSVSRTSASRQDCVPPLLRDYHIRYSSGYRESPAPSSHPSPVASAVWVGMSDTSHHAQSSQLPEEPVGCSEAQSSVREDDTMPHLLPDVCDPATSLVFSQAVPREELNIIEQSHGRAEESTQTTPQMAKPCEALTEKAETCSQIAADMSKVSAGANIEETVGILKAALGETDQSIRITAHALLLALGEKIGPLELMKPSTDSPISDEKVSPSRAPSDVMPRLLNIGEHGSCAISKETLVVSPKVMQGDFDSTMKPKRASRVSSMPLEDDGENSEELKRSISNCITATDFTIIASTDPRLVETLSPTSKNIKDVASHSIREPS